MITCLALVAAALIALVTSPALGGALETDLKVYVDKLRRLYPEAEVTGRFYDWRSVSMYRSHAGMHLGYDIALNAGRQVPAGWPGRVVGIIPWTDAEYGVCVETAGGYRVTYGHLTPSVREGDIVQPGMYVGSVARDHVDIKVKDGSGGYLDWGATFGVLDGSAAWTPGGLGLLPPPPGMGGGPPSAGMGVEGLVEAYRLQARLAATRRAERNRARELVSLLGSYIDHESTGLPQAESQMLAWYRAADDHKVSEAQVEAISLTLKARRTRVTRLGYTLMGRERDLREKEAAYKSAKESADAMREAALRAGAKEDRLKKVGAEARAAGRKDAAVSTNSGICQRVADAERKYSHLKDRYAQGGASKTALDEAARALERLRVVQGLWEHGRQADAYELSW